MLKTLSFAAVHFTVAFTVGYLLTGSFALASAVALIEPMANTVAYHFHEKAWARWGAHRRPVAVEPERGLAKAA
jgi:uncharacterized membrane protein